MALRHIVTAQAAEVNDLRSIGLVTGRGFRATAVPGVAAGGMLNAAAPLAAAAWLLAGAALRVIASS